MTLKRIPILNIVIALGVATLLVGALFVTLAPRVTAAGPTVFINEIHYDNASTDVNEGVEIAGPAGTDLSGWSIVLYNGNGGGQYATINLSGSIPDQQSGFGTLWFAHASIQNGTPDGLALVNSSSTVIQFLSYEGSFAATDGPANGMTSTDIGVAESSSTTAEESLQLQGTGNGYDDFTWASPMANTRGAVNTGQTFEQATPKFTISKSAPDKVSPGEVFTYTLTVKNSTGVTPTTTVITDVLPTGVDFASASDGGGINASNIVSWTVSDFTDGATISRTFMVTVTGSQDIKNVYYGVNGGSDWPTTTLGISTTTKMVAGVHVKKTAPDLVAPGALFTYTLTIENQTGGALNDLVISDTLPFSATYASSDPTGNWDDASHTITWTTASLAHDSTLTRTLVVTAPDEMTTLTNDDYVAYATEWITPTTGLSTTTLVRDCNTIYGIQHVDNPGSDDASLCMGKNVTLQGIVYATYGSSKYFIADATGPWHGLYVYGSAPAVGDEVEITGDVQEYHGITELHPTSLTVLSSGNTPYAPSVVTAAQIPYGDVATSEQYESVFVETHDITVTAAIDSHGIWDFSDVGGGTAKADDWGYHAEPAVDDTFAILRGALAYDWSEYKVMPRDANDLVTERQISIEKTAAANVDSGELLTYTLTMVNNTGSTLNSPTITDTVPAAHATFAYALDCGVESGGVVTWTAASLPSGDSLSMHFVITATGTDGDEIWNNTYAAWAANWLTPTAGSPLLTTIGDYTPIYSIQGNGFTSPYDGQQVRTVGVVIGFFEGNYPGSGTFDGFYIQAAAGDSITSTSDAVFVNHGTAAVSVAVGDLVTVTGTVGEFSEYDGTACTGDACLTQIAVSGASDVEVGPNVTPPTATELDPPGGDVAVAATYWESLEGMLVTLPNTATVVGPTSYNTIVVVRGDLGVEHVLRTGPYAGMPVSVRHYKLNGKLDDGSNPDNLIVGSTVENVDGPLAYSYGTYLVATQAGDVWTTVYDKPAPTTVPTWPAAHAEQFSAATFNTYNYGGGATKLTKVVSTVVGLGAPTFLSLEEISVENVITDVLDALNAQGYPYAYAYSHPDVGGHGVALIWRTDRVTDVTWSTDYQGCSADGSSSSTYDPLWDTCRASGEYPLFSRRPVVITGTVTYDGNATRVVVIGNHFKSKRGGDPSADQRRLEQGQFVAGLVDGFVTTVPNILVLGDLNDFEDSPPLEALYASGNLTSTWYTLPEEARYSYIYQGTSQILDHILASPAMLTWLDSMSPMHYNADFPYYPYSGNNSVVWRTSDHDPVVATFALPRYIYLPLVFRNSS